MKNIRLTALLLILCVAFAGCFAGCATERNAKLKTTAKMPKNMPVGNQNRSQSRVSINKTTKVFFYYSSKCPICREVKPYMELIRKTDSKSVEFYFCDVYNMSNCSKVCQWLAKHVGITEVPTVIIAHGHWVKMYSGLDVLNTALFLHMLGLPVPKARLNNTTYNTTLCINCHLKRNIKLPDKYECTYCCHLSKAKNSTLRGT